jgi:hypothetical protein
MLTAFTAVVLVMFVRRQTVSAPDTVCVLTALDAEAAAALFKIPSRKFNSS